MVRGRGIRRVSNCIAAAVPSERLPVQNERNRNPIYTEGLQYRPASEINSINEPDGDAGVVLSGVRGWGLGLRL